MKHVARRMNILLLTGVMTVPALIACSPQDADDRAASGEPLASAPTMTELAGLGYAGVYEEPVTLADGRWEGEPYEDDAASRPMAGLVEDVYLSGDLDGDGADEAVVMLWETAGGSGINSYVAVVGRRDGNAVNIGTALLGDRVQMRAGRIIDARIELDLVQSGPNDAACCPTETVTRVWEMGVDGLIEGEVRNKGSLSLADIEGQEWLLEGMNRDEAVPDGLEVTLRVATGRLSGRSACNRYFGSVTAGDSPGLMTVGKLGSTRMACPQPAMDLEARYLQVLSSVTGFGFLNGRLALTSQQDGVVTVLLYTSGDRARPAGLVSPSRQD